jgi:hypothetical protein
MSCLVAGGRRPSLVCLTVLLAASLVATGCTGRSIVQAGEAAAISRVDAQTLDYQGLGDASVLLRDGRYEGPPFIPGAASRRVVSLLDDIWWSGDLDGDGDPEAIVVLVDAAGGSGSFVHLALLGRRDGRVVNLDTVLLGDRVRIRALRVEGALVVLEAVERGAGDPACCPSALTERIWSLDGDRLSGGAPSFTGHLSAADAQRP